LIIGGAERVSSSDDRSVVDMSKLLFFILIAVAVYWLLRPSPGEGKSRRRAGPAAEPMVACARCGLHVPASESVEADGRHYCCQEHRRLGAGDSSRG
jgi:uncharacterized protein